MMSRGALRYMAFAVVVCVLAPAASAEDPILIFWPEQMTTDPYHPLVGMSVSFDVTQQNSSYYAWFTFRNVSTDPTARIHKIGIEDGVFFYEKSITIFCEPIDRVDFELAKGAIGGYRYAISTKADTGGEKDCLGPNAGPDANDVVKVRFQLLPNTPFRPGDDIVAWLDNFYKTYPSKSPFGFQAINVTALNGQSINAHCGPDNSFVTPELSSVWLLLASLLCMAALGSFKRGRNR